MSLRIPVSNKDHIEGNPEAEIELVEYGDYQCPYCGQAYYEIKKVQKHLGKDLKFVFRNFPLTDSHEHALSAAVAAEVAGDLGKFWEMHDTLYENQENLGDSSIVNYAKKLGLNTDEFENDFSDSKYQKKIEDQMEGGLRSGVNGTPSFFINGQKYEGDYTAESILEYMRSI